MHKWREKHPDYPNYKASRSRHDDDSGSSDAELSEAAGTVYDTAAEHRARVIERDKAAKARKRKHRG